MQSTNARSAVLVGLALIALAAFLVILFPTGEQPRPETPESARLGSGTEALQGDLEDPQDTGLQPLTDATGRSSAGSVVPTGVRGIVLDQRTGAPLPGMEVVAMRRMPSMERLEARFRGLFQSGLWQQSHKPVEVLGAAVTGGDGRFEILGLEPGMVFLDGRSDGFYVRTPGSARLARGEVAEGIELLGSPGGRVQGVVLGADGAPAAGAVVSLRPGLNAFLGQLTERKYRWLETLTDADGRFDLPGVPTGSGYTLSASSSVLALEELHGLEVREGHVTRVTVRGHAGAVVAGRVLDGDGAPVAGANVAMVYLDVSRVLFSADGREEPVLTDAEGRFRLERVSSGRVAFMAAADGLAPSNIQELAVVDGGVYQDLELRLGEGLSKGGIVVDQDDQPVAGAAVELRPMERPRDPEFLKMALKIRRIEVTTGADGRFQAGGLAGDRLMVQAGKPGYTTAIATGVKLDQEELRLQIFRGATVRGRVTQEDGTPIARFSVEARSRPIARGDTAGAAAPEEEGGNGGEDAEPQDAEPQDRGTGFQVRMGGPGGRGNRGGWGRDFDRQRVRQLPEGEQLMDRGLGDRWREIADSNGEFLLTGLPPGRIQVRVRAEGYLDSARQEVELQGGERSDELAFVLKPGVVARGVVVDAMGGAPVADAQVSAYRADSERSRRGGFFRPDVDPEDFDFLGMSAAMGRRNAVTNLRGEFEIEGLRPGTYRFTARHPDMAKASAREVEVLEGSATEGVRIELDSGGGVEGTVTGFGMRPLPDALIVAFSIQAGSLKSDSTDSAGYYRIDGLPPGQYLVFKSRMDERSDNLGLDLMSNMRLKSVTVRKGGFARLDIHDETEDGVRIHGIVREAGQPVPRALVTALGTDREGFFGMGVRANAADAEGRYELIGIKPGSYLFQVSMFRGRPVQTSIMIEVPDGVTDYQLDLDLPEATVSGIVIDSNGAPVAGVQVALGAESGGIADAEGMLGLIARNGLSQARTDDEGRFRIRSVAAGTYRLTASGRRGGRGNRSAPEYGEAALEDVTVDGVTPVEGLQIVLPLAGRITGVVLDGSGNPVSGAEVHCADQERRRTGTSALTDLLGMQQRPASTDAQGRFEIGGLTPGTYTVRADAEGLETGVAGDLAVLEGRATDVTLHIVRGATLRVRVTNVDREQVPLGNISLLDGEDRPVVRKISTMTVLRRLMGNQEEVKDSGWYEFGSVPPDTYTVVVTEKGKPEVRITRAIADGETVEWDIDMAAELEAREKAGK